MRSERISKFAGWRYPGNAWSLPSFLLALATGAPWTAENDAFNLNNVRGTTDARQYGHHGWKLPSEYFPSPEDWRAHPVYQILVDRFYDGDPTNNAQNDGLLFDWRTNTGPLAGFDVRDMTERQGGDWKGVTQKLDYIRGMGCRALWISPVQQNDAGSPMGYLSLDKTLLERRFGNLEDLREMVAQAHKRGIYVVVDLVNNHMAELLDWAQNAEDDKELPFRMHEGGSRSSALHPDRGRESPIRPKMKLKSACCKTPGCDPEAIQPYVDFPFDNTWYDDGTYQGVTFRESGFSGLPLAIRDSNGTGGFWDSSFHHSGGMPATEDLPWSWPLAKLYGTLDDLRTTDDKVVDKLIAVATALIAAVDIDGFRLDTPRECAYSSWTRWRTAVDAAANRYNKRNFGTWGELWSTPERAATYVGRGKDIPMYFDEGFINPDRPVFDGLINYNFFQWIVTVFREKRVDQSYMAFNILDWEARLGYDISWPQFPVNGTDREPRYAMWNFCGSHDQHRLTQFADGHEMIRLCQAWLYTWPGIPVTYQGDEQGFKTPGSGLAYWGRESMATSAAWQQVPTVERLGVMENPSSGDNFDEASPVYRFYRRLGNLRDLWWEDAFKCLGDGPKGTGLPQRVDCRGMGGQDLPGVFAYRRSCRRGAFGVVMVLNLKNDSLRARCPGVTGQLINVLKSKGEEFLQELEGDVLDISPFEVKALVDSRRTFNFHVSAVSPRHDAALPLDVWDEQHLVDVTFDDQLQPGTLQLELNGVPLSDLGYTTVGISGRTITLRLPSLGVGVHTLRVTAAQSITGAPLASAHSWRLRIGLPTSPLLTRPLRVDHDILNVEGSSAWIMHSMPSASYFRVHNAGERKDWDRSSAWQPMNSSHSRWPTWQPGVPVIVQYYAAGSAAYMLMACKITNNTKCAASYYGRGPGRDSMTFRGELNQWLDVWNFEPPREVSASNLWTLDVYVSVPDTKFIIDVEGDLTHVMGTGNDVANPFFFPYEAWCFDGLALGSKGMPYSGCESPLPGPLAKTQRNLCACNMQPKTMYLYDSGMNHTEKWMLEHFPNFWRQTSAQGLPTYHGLNIRLRDGSSGEYNMRIPSSVCPLHSTCRITFNDLTLSFSVTRSPPGVVGLGDGSIKVSAFLCVLCMLLPTTLAVLGMARKWHQSIVHIVQVPVQASGEKFLAAPRSALVASLEYIIRHESGTEKAVAGGLGKVAGLLCQHHPGPLICVHACMPDTMYSFSTRTEPVHAVVSGRQTQCEVFVYQPDVSSPEWTAQESGSVTFLLVDHPLFRNRQKGVIYPVPQTLQSTLEFYSLWNQVVAQLIDRLRPEIFHCPDFHAAMAVMYLERPIPVALVLHNAEYQGSIATQYMGRDEAKWFGEIFNLPAARIRRETFHEGKFCMLKPTIDHVRKHQASVGICAVSRNYAMEVMQKHTLLWGTEVRGIENCMPETERMSAYAGGEAEYSSAKNAAKSFVQLRYGLKQNPDARICTFLGRWVKQKGVDFIADVAEWMLTTYPQCQLVVIGPVGDAYGIYAKAKLEGLAKSKRFAGSLFVHAGFLLVPQELKLATDFCLMPSRDEPFGYVDIEFAWFGAAIVGSLRGGLGKLPGFYFQILNADSAVHMQHALQSSIRAAMSCEPSTLQLMSGLARRSNFAVETWQSDLSKLYSDVLHRFSWPDPCESVSSGSPMSRSAMSMSPASNNLDRGVSHEDNILALPSLPPVVSPAWRHLTKVPSWPACCSERVNRPEFLRQEHSELEIQNAMELKLSAGRATGCHDAGALLEEIQWELEMALEQRSCSKLLGIMIAGAPLLDWIIGLCYISGPLVSSISVAHVDKHDSMAFLVVDPLTQSFALILWTVLAKFVQPNVLMILVCTARALSLSLPLAVDSTRLAAVAAGIVSPGDYVFIYYSFMGSSVGDLSQMAMRTGFLMVLREEWRWLLPVSEWTGHQQVVIRLVCLVAFAVLPACALARAPRLYSEFRLPVLELHWVGRLRFLLLLALACILQALSQVSASALLVTRQTSPFKLEDPSRFMGMLALSSAASMLVLSILLRAVPSYAMSIVRAVACFSLPASLLQNLAQIEINQATGLTWALDVVICATVALQALSSYAIAIAVLATVGSRWRFVSYACFVGVGSSLAQAASFAIVSLHTGRRDPLKTTWMPQDLSWELFTVAAPPCLLALLLRFVAFYFFDMEATGIIRTRRQRLLVRAALSKKPKGLSDDPGHLPEP